MKINKFKAALILIVILGFLIRYLYLNSAPPGLNADEAALGYNAYSLLKTGRDEWGESYPIVFKSFSDYKPGLYVYLAIPFVALMGLTETAVRFPSVVLGTLSILVIYFISKEIFIRRSLALISAFMLALSPWHIHYSRGAWETNIATFFISLGVLGFIKGFKNGKWWVVSAVSFILSMYAYQSTRLIVPVLIISLGLLYYKRLLRKSVLIAFLIGVILIIPFVTTIFSNSGLARFQGVSIFSDIGPNLRTNVSRGEHNNPSGVLAETFHNKIVAYSLNFSLHYLDHFAPNFLFVTGDELGRNHVPEMGQMYLFEILTVLFGLFLIFQKDNEIKYKNILLSWLLIAPIAASLTFQTPHALRAHNMIFPLILISSYGAYSIWIRLKSLKFTFKFPITLAVSIAVIFFSVRFIDLYFVHLPRQHAMDWEYGFSKLVPYLFEQKDSYEKIVVTDRYDQPYILFLFYSKYDPALYQTSKKVEVDNGYGFTTIKSFDKFEFRRVNEGDLEGVSNKIFVGSKDEFGNLNSFDYLIGYPNGEPAFKVVKK